MRSIAGTSLFSFYLLTSHISPCRTLEIVPRANVVPAPLSIPPAQNWEGIDGPWNTFALQLGNPPQTVRVHVSTAIQQVWAVASVGCAALNQTMCDDRRGGNFNTNTSTTWKQQGTYKLWSQQNLGFNDPQQDIGIFGYDSVSVGYMGQGIPAVEKQVIATYSTYDFLYGYLGINPKPTNWTDFNDPYPSYITSLKDRKMIPSISWGFTAGAPYRFASVLASLTLGGYDSSRFIPNNVTIPLAADNERDILVSIEGINAVGPGLPSTNLISQSFTSPIYAYIDSTAPHIWLPKEICDVFERTFNLTYDNTTDLYHISDYARQQLLTTNPNITFTISANPGVDDKVQITLPYNAFDKEARPPYKGVKQRQRYFPLRRALNPNQYTLGRTFLQEAYLMVDWERRNFSVYQNSWVPGAQQHIVPILPPGSPGSSSSKGSLSAGALAGIIIGVAAAATTLLAILFLLYRRKKRSQHAKDKADEAAATSTITTISTVSEPTEKGDNVIPKAELDGSSPTDAHNPFYNPEKAAADLQSPTDSDACNTWLNPVEADSKQMEIYEMPGDEPKMPEADGRQYSEKEAMRAREERYNGVDTYDPQTPVSIDSRMTRRSPVSPSDVFEVIDRVGPRGNPVSPIEGSDGSRTMAFSPLSPLEGTVMNISPNSTSRMTNLSAVTATNLSSGTAGSGTGKTPPERKRFSYED